MSPRIILVTGSRVLGDHDCEHAPHARAVLETLLALSPPRTAIVTGDAPGPDEWAREWCYQHRPHALRVYALSGAVYNGLRAEHRRWSTEADDLANTLPERVPLLRNARMVAQCAELQRSHDARVEVIGLVAEWSTTKGTEHTLRLAKEAGFPSVVVRWTR